MDIEQFRKAGYAAIDQICDYYKSLEERPVWAQVKPNFLTSTLPQEAPEQGEPWEKIQDDWKNIILPGITHWQHPNFYAYFPCNASMEGMLAELQVASIINPGFNWSCSPSVTELELLVLDWVAKMLGLSQDFWNSGPSGKGGGIILGSASEVALTIAIAARERAITDLSKENPVPILSDHLPNGHSPAAAPAPTNEPTKREREQASQVSKWRGDLTSRLVMYGTTQTHSIGLKAAMILGLDFRALEVHAEDAYALRGDTLQKALEEDTKAGRVPFMLIATIGTTSSGAIDNLTEIMAVAQQYPSLWVHVDAAYAGVALARPELRAMAHIDAVNTPVDSFSTNYHKWGLTQFDCSPVHVRDRGALTRALTVTPQYLRTKEGDAGSVMDLRNMQISLGRRFRSLKLWYVLRSYGLSGFRRHITTTMDLAAHLKGLLEAQESLFEIVAPPTWALVVFRLRLAGHQGQSKELDSLNTRFWEALSAQSEHFALTQTVLPEIGFCIRFAVGSPRTKVEHIEATFDRIKECADSVLRDSKSL